MKIIRHDKGGAQFYADLPIGACFVLPRGDATYIKVKAIYSGVSAACLRSGICYDFSPTREVLEVEATLDVYPKDY